MNAPFDADALVETVLPRILAAAVGLEFRTFLVGARLPQDLRRADPGAQEEFRRSLRDALLARLASAWPDRRCVASAGDLGIVLVPGESPRARIQIAPLYVAGRYRKLVRGLSQTAFHCRGCRGRGCPDCGGTGRLVAEAVEDFVRPPIQSSALGRRSSFHGSGREDVDVRMLGGGRPFVVSVRSPRRRAIDAALVEREVASASGGRVEVSDLRVVGRRELAQITSGHGRKLYRALVGLTRPIGEEDAGRLAGMRELDVLQRTPRRVEERRADAVRPRRVHEVALEWAQGCRASVTIRTDPGTYVKELVSGDEGRTQPSFASVLGQPCVCEELDVIGAD